MTFQGHQKGAVGHADCGRDCAAGKATLLAQLMTNAGVLIALDNRPNRVELIRSMSLRLGATIVRAELGDATKVRICRLLTHLLFWSQSLRDKLLEVRRLGCLKSRRVIQDRKQIIERALAVTFVTLSD